MRGIMRYMNHIHRSTAVVYNNRLKEYGISYCQHPYINLVCHHPGITQEELAHSIGVHKSNVTRQINALEKSGILMRNSDPQDKRIQRIFPTEKAQELLPHIQKVMREWNQFLLEGFTDAEYEKLVSVLDIISSRATEMAHDTLHSCETEFSDKGCDKS